MAQYYDPTTWKTIDPNSVGSIESEDPSTFQPVYRYYDKSALRPYADDWGNETGRYYIPVNWDDPYAQPPTEYKQGDVNSAFLQQYGGTPTVRNYLSGLLGQGYSANDLDGALRAYFGQAGHGEYKDRAWLGDQALLRAYGTGLDSLGKSTGWNSLYNADLERQQQAGMHDLLTHDDGNDWDEFTKVLGGIGAVLTAGAAAGAFGGAGLFGGANSFPVGGADWMGEIAAGAGGGGAAAANPLATGGLDWMSEVAAGGGTPAATTGGGNVSLLDDVLEQLGGVGDTPISEIGGSAGQSAADALIESTLNGGSEFGTTSAGGPLANGWQGQLANALSGIPNLPPGVNTAIRSLLGGSAGGASASSAIGRILGGTGSASDWASVLGSAGTGVLDYLGNEKRFDYAKGVDERNWGAGAPSRARYEAAMQPGFDISNMPGYKQAFDTATETYLRKLSATGGNPAGIGAAPSQTMAYTMGTVGLPAWQQYVNQNANAGGIGALSSNSTSTGMGLADASGGTYNSLGKSIGAITNPTTSLRDLLSLNSFT